MKIKAAMTVVENEYNFASLKYPEFSSAHEGYAIIKEEVDELWDAVKLQNNNIRRTKKMRNEAAQVAAMAIRFLVDVCGD